MLCIEREYKDSQDSGHIIWRIKCVSPIPPNPDFTADEFDKKSDISKREGTKLKKLKSMAYTLIMGQCSSNVTVELEGQLGFEKIAMREICLACCSLSKEYVASSK